MSIGSVSVIISCHYPTSLFLAEAIESILQQSRPAQEIIIVDNGFNTAIRSIAFQYPSTHYLHLPRQNLATLHNAGLHKSQGDYLVFLHPDDRLLPGALEIGASSLDAAVECGLMVGIARQIGMDGLPLKSAIELLEQSHDVAVYQTLLSGTPLTPLSRIIWRRRVVEQVGGFDPKLAPAAEYDLCLRVAATTMCGRCNQAFVEYQDGSGDAAPGNSANRAMPYLRAYLGALDKQKAFVEQSQQQLLRSAYWQGRQQWCQRYGNELIRDMGRCLKQGQWATAYTILRFALRYYPQGLMLPFQKLHSGSALSIPAIDQVHPLF